MNERLNKNAEGPHKSAETSPIAGGDHVVSAPDLPEFKPGRIIKYEQAADFSRLLRSRVIDVSHLRFSEVSDSDAKFVTSTASIGAQVLFDGVANRRFKLPEPTADNLMRKALAVTNNAGMTTRSEEEQDLVETLGYLSRGVEQSFGRKPALRHVVEAAAIACLDAFSTMVEVNGGAIILGPHMAQNLNAMSQSYLMAVTPQQS